MTLEKTETLPGIISGPGIEKHNGRAADEVVSVQNVGKMYHLYDRPQDRLKQALLWRLGRSYGRQFWALRDISFEVRRGEALGIIGRNGSGKSTLLQIIAGIIPPTTGEARVQGRVASLLELGSGFNPEYTGRENVYLNGAILGFSRAEMDARFDEIADFAEIGDFIDQPVKIYSSGMFVRLGFAVQACLEPDVLLVDEALSVGDIFFQQKCHARMEQLLAHNTAILMVSHNMESITKYSTKTMLLDQGRCLYLGQPDDVVYRYYTLTEESRRSRTPPASPRTITYSGVNTVATELAPLPDWPHEDAFLDLSQAVILGANDIARCTHVALCNTQGQPCAAFHTSQVACFYYEFELLQDIEVPVGGVDIINAKNILMHGSNSLHYLAKVPMATPKGTRVRFRQTMELALLTGEYTFTIGLATISASDYIRLTKSLPYGYPHQEVLTLLRVRQIGKILIQPRTEGITTPFHGYVNLRGDCVLSVNSPHELA